jgi:hypothetical protein
MMGIRIGFALQEKSMGSSGVWPPYWALCALEAGWSVWVSFSLEFCSV